MAGLVDPLCSRDPHAGSIVCLDCGRCSSHARSMGINPGRLLGQITPY